MTTVGPCPRSGAGPSLLDCSGRLQKRWSLERSGTSRRTGARLVSARYSRVARYPAEVGTVMGEDEAEAMAPRLAARLETMAKLARPVQHEINNLLTVIFANLEMLKRTAAEGAPQRQLDRVAEAARRFEASSRGFLSLSRRPVPGVSDFTLHEALVALRPLLVVLMPTPSMLAIEAEAESGPVRLDRALLDEALIALA